MPNLDTEMNDLQEASHSYFVKIEFYWNCFLSSHSIILNKYLLIIESNNFPWKYVSKINCWVEVTVYQDCPKYFTYVST